jgi:hypothetical protein
MTTELEEITGHIERNIGKVHTIFHEIISDDLHIDVLHVKSTLFRRYEVLVTSGMSTRPMVMPPESKEPRFSEVLIILPKGWPLTQPDFDDERNYWPIRLIKSLARYPHHNNTWLGYGHTISGEDAVGERTTPYEEDRHYWAAVILPSMTLDESAWTFKNEAGHEVFFWAAVPIYMNELEYKREHGIDLLLDLFDKYKVTDRVDSKRSSVVGHASAI